MGGKQIPEHLLTGPEVQSMWLEINKHIVILNDVVSLKKEFVRHPAAEPITQDWCEPMLTAVILNRLKVYTAWCLSPCTRPGVTSTR